MTEVRTDSDDPAGVRDRSLVVYLDQWAYVRLASVGTGKGSGNDLRARDLLRAGRLDGRAIYPLSKVHYLETWSQGSDVRRRVLAAEMFRLSGFLTITPPEVLWRTEIRNAVQSVFGRPGQPEIVEPLGMGAAHAFGRALLPGELTRHAGERWVVQELALLAGSNPANFRDEERERFVAGELFAAKENAFSTKLATWKTTPRDREQRFRIHAMTLFEREFAGALIGAGVTLDEFAALDADGLENLVESVPTIWTLTELRRVRLANPNASVKRTDLNDLRALAAAIVYCDVVVADKAWADAVRRTDLDARFGTMTCAKVEQAAEAIIEDLAT